MSDCITLLHQNSSFACPQDERENAARFALRGKDIVFVALADGTLKALDAEAFIPCRAETGIMRSAGWTFSSAVKNDAVRVVLYTPVN